MNIGVVGTGFVGGVLGRALARSGHAVTFGSRHPDDDDVVGDTSASVSSIADALAGAEVVLLALPGAAVSAFLSQHGETLDGVLVIDATNQMGTAKADDRAVRPSGMRYARAFNTLGGEVMEQPVFAGGVASMFFTAPEGDRSTVEAVIADVGLQPVYVGPDQEELVDSLFRLWIALAVGQHRGRRLALRLLEG